MTIFEWIEKNIHEDSLAEAIYKDIMNYKDKDEVIPLDVEGWKLYLEKNKACETVKEAFRIVSIRYQYDIDREEEGRQMNGQAEAAKQITEQIHNLDSTVTDNGHIEEDQIKQTE